MHGIQEELERKVMRLENDVKALKDGRMRLLDERRVLQDELAFMRKVCLLLSSALGLLTVIFLLEL